MKFYVIAILSLFLIILTSCAPQKDVRSMTTEEIEAIPMEDRLKMIEEEVAKNPLREMTDIERAAEKENMEAMSDGNVEKAGSFERRSHPTSGSIQIVEKDGHALVILSDDFKSDSGPELHIILTEHANPKSSRDVHTGEYVDLGILKSTKGTQTYEVPTDKIGNFKTAVVYCKPFRVIFGLATLS